jgi:DNA-binding PadR family transcriptional regulator
LHKLLDEDLLETTSEMMDGRLRKYYSLSNKGKKDVIKKVDILKSSLDAVQLLLNNKLSYG